MWAREISPGRASGPPPIRLGREAEWCGVRKGRSVISPWPAGAQLALDVLHVVGGGGPGAADLVKTELDLAGDGPAAAQVGGSLRQGAHGKDDGAFHGGHLPGVVCREDHPLEALFPGGKHHRQRAAHRAAAAVQRQLPEDQHAVQRLFGDLPGRRQDGQGDGQVEGGAFLAQVRRGQVDGDPAGGAEKPAVAQRGHHPVPAFADGGVGQADHRQPEAAAGDIRLHLHRDPVHPAQRAAQHG